MTNLKMGEGRVRHAATLMMSAALVAVLCFAGLAFPATAQASDGSALRGSGATVALETQAGSLASAKASVINKTAVKNAKSIVKSAKATKGTSLAKLKKIFTYIAKDKSFGGVYSFPEQEGGYFFFYTKALGTASASYYPAAQPKDMKTFYRKYAIDAFKTKKASCHHYASLFAVAAKQALGKKATVKIGLQRYSKGGATQIHSWVEVKIGKKTYVYDTQKGNLNSKETGKKTDFGKFCGSQKASMKSYYKNFKSTKYCTVTL